MTSPETMDKRAMGERRRRRMAERGATEPQPPPMTRREMKARGILLTSEIPVVEEPPDWPERSGAAAAADRSSAVRAGAIRALTATEETSTGEFRTVALDDDASAGTTTAPPAQQGDIPASVGRARRGRRASSQPEPEPLIAPESEPDVRLEEEAAPSSAHVTPSRRTLREKWRAAGASAADGPAERTSTVRRPVVRAPITARGVRTVDESGEITGVQPAVTGTAPAGPPVQPPVAWAPVGPPAGVPPQPTLPPVQEWTTSPSNWESAVAMPAVVMGIEDSPEPPTGDRPVTPPRPSVPEDVPQSEGESSTDTDRDAAPAAPEAGANVADESAPIAGEDVEPAPREATDGIESVTEPSAPTEAALPTRRSIARSRGRAQQGEDRAQGEGEGDAPATGPSRWLTIVLLIVAGLALGALVYLIASGRLGSLFADGVPGALPGSVALAGAAVVPYVSRGLRGC